jgi:hypothetical protein
LSSASPGDSERRGFRTGNYRITFGWEGENAINVDLADYH